MKTRIVLMTVALACGALLMAQQVGEMTMEKEDADNLVKVPSYSP